MVKEIGVQSQVESYQRLIRMVLDPTWINAHYGRVGTKGKWSYSG